MRIMGLLNVQSKKETKQPGGMSMNYCQVCQSQLDDKLNCPKCGTQPKSGTAQGPKLAKRRVKVPAVAAVVVDVDRTGSSEPFAAGIPKIFERTAKGLAERISEIKYYVWSHGDLDCEEQPIQLVQGVDLAQAIKAIQTIRFDGGGDPAENHADQLENLVNVTQWGADPLCSRNILVMFATDDTKPLRSGKSMKQLGKEIKDRGIFLFLVCQETKNLREIVDAAGGFIIPISTEPDEKEIQQVVSSLTASIMSTVNQGATISMSATRSQSAAIN